MIYDIIIIGAGASGLVAAYEISRQNQQLHILVLEKESIPGRKLSASGNGKGNLTNKSFDASKFYSQNEDFIETFIKQHSYMEILSFFEKTGILLYEKNGYFYPVSNQAKQITQLLYDRCLKMGVEFTMNTKVFSVETDSANKNRHSYIVKALKEKEKLTQHGKQQTKLSDNSEESVVRYQAAKVILCTGGMAAPKLGGSDSGYKISSRLCLKQEKTVPVLTPAYVKDADLKLAKGVRLETVVSLRKGGNLIGKECGQLQINEDNFSGIAIMNLSCYFNQFTKEERTECLQIDTFPYITWEKLKAYFENQKKNEPQDSAITLLEGLFPVKFAEYLLKKTGIDYEISIGRLTQRQINRLTSFIKKMVVTPIETFDYDKAQVTAGGVCIEEIYPDSFECKRYPGLFVIGELLDMNGKCGGYNLSFAILSGLQAAHRILSEYAD